MREQAPEHARTERSNYPETFGIEPHTYERDVPSVIRALASALHRFEDEAGSDEEIRQVFGGVYDAEKIEEDLAEVHRLRHVYETEDSLEERKHHLYSLVLELIICDLSNEWFPGCTVWRAYSFDDYKRQTDLFMDIPGPEGQLLTLAVDVTSSREAASHKLDDSLEEFRSGWFHDVDYFASDTDPDRPRGRQFFPRVVAGASYRNIASLARLYGAWLKAGERSKNEAMEQLRHHELARQMYQELLRQLDLAHTYLRRNLKDQPTFKQTLRESLKSHAQYVDAARRALRERYEKIKGSSGGETEPPLNGVLDAILEYA